MAAVNISILVRKGADGAKMHTWSRDIGHIGSSPAILTAETYLKERLRQFQGWKGRAEMRDAWNNVARPETAVTEGDRVSQ